MRYIIPIMLLALLPFAMAAINPNAGEYGFQFLQIPANPVTAALAGTGIYGSNYAGAFMYNPAANLMDERFSLSVQHTLWLVDTNYSQIVYSNGRRNKHFGLAARILDYGKIDTRDDSGNIIGNYHPLDLNLMTNFSWRLFPDHLLGINAGLVYEKLDTASSYGISADLGYVFLTPITNAVYFASVKNLGLTSKMEEESISLPLTLETGLGYTIPETNWADNIAVQLAFNKALDTDIRAAVASEISLLEMLDLRLGYKFFTDEEGLTAGIGINWQNLNIDYGWSANSDRLNDTHSFGITYNF